MLTDHFRDIFGSILPWFPRGRLTKLLVSFATGGCQSTSLFSRYCGSSASTLVAYLSFDDRHELKDKHNTRTFITLFLDASLKKQLQSPMEPNARQSAIVEILTGGRSRPLEDF